MRGERTGGTPLSTTSRARDMIRAPPEDILMRRHSLLGSIILLAGAACATTSSGAGSTPAATAPSPAGRWQGVLRVPASVPSRLVITLDSTDGAWHGTLLTTSASRASIPFDSVTRVRGILVMHLPKSAQGVRLVAALSTDGSHISGSVQDDFVRATFRIARAGSPEAASLLAEASSAEESRRVAAAMVDSTESTPHTDPDSAKLVTSDIALFWRALDMAAATNLATVLQREYLDRASVGVRDFIPGRIISAADLAAYVTANHARYDSVRAANLDVTRADSAIRAAFHRLKSIYPPAVFPDVYFVIGRFNSGGTSSRHGLLIGAEMYRDPARLPAIVSHELIHYQQHYESSTCSSTRSWKGRPTSSAR